MKVIKLIETRFGCAFGRNVKDEMLVKASRSKAKDVAVILTENQLTHYHGENKEYVIALRENNRLKGMFDLGAVLPNTDAHLILYIFTKDRPNRFTVGEYRGKVKQKKIQSGKEFDWNTLYFSEFYNYIDKIDKWIETGKVEGNEFAKFNTLENKMFEDIFAPKRYSKDACRVKAALADEKTVCLSEVAEIIRPMSDRDRNKRSMFLFVPEWKYPIDYTKLREGVLTNAPIRKYDILFRDFEKMYLVDEDPQCDFHISPNFYVIRPKSILPHYLFMYLQSDTAKTIMQSLSMGGVLNRIRKTDMEKIPIVLPKLGNDEYLSTFRLRFYEQSDIAEFSRVKRLMPHMQVISGGHKTRAKNVREKKEIVEDILEEEWTKKIKVHKNEVMKEFLESDIDELNTCFRGKAYKATLILAGSILEAVLIDWLSEIEGVNYFDEDYIIQIEKWRKGKKVYYEKKAVLADYIKAIEELAEPKWMKADKADKIREKRNLVHAKLCMKESVEINEQTCREVIQYLKEVIETRSAR